MGWALRVRPNRKIPHARAFYPELSFGQTKAKQTFHATVAPGIEARSAEDDDARVPGR